MNKGSQLPEGFPLLEHGTQDYSDLLNRVLLAAAVGAGVVSDRVLQEVNQIVCDMLGYDPMELIGKSSRILYENDEEFERIGREKYELISSTGKGTVETVWIKKNGTPVDVRLSSVPLDPSDHKRNILFTAIDISEKKQAERDLDRSQNSQRGDRPRAGKGSGTQSCQPTQGDQAEKRRLNRAEG